MKCQLLFALLFVAVLGCNPSPKMNNGLEYVDWKYSDLRMLDPIDSAEANNEIIALYTRILDQKFQMRLDFLDLDWRYGYDLYIAIDTLPGGTNQVKTIGKAVIKLDLMWDYLLYYSSTGDTFLLDHQYIPISGAGVMINQGDAEDYVTLSFNLKSVPIQRAITRIQVLLALPGQGVVVDLLDPISIDAPSPARIKVAFMFWNTFTARTPAETLRSWAGAHSGPMSSRHGLKYLLDAAMKTDIPVAILGIDNPEAYSAFDYLNILQMINDMNKSGLLEVISKGHYEKYCEIECEDKKMNLDYINCNFYDYFLCGNDYANIIKNSTLFILNNQNNDVDAALLFIDNCKRSLIQNAILQTPAPLLIGGDFTSSLLGDPNVSFELFTYIRNHPWIEAISAHDFVQRSTPGQTHITDHSALGNTEGGSLSSSTGVRSQLYKELLIAPDNQLSDLAWEVFEQLERYSSPDLQSLSDNFIGSIGVILEAASWIEQPRSINTCNIDLDFDSHGECILSTDRVFVTLEPEGGYIPFIFSKDDRGPHQIVGPTWEFIMGYSDPSVWDPTRGIRSDPEQILGAFDFEDDERVNIIFDDRRMIIDKVDMSMRKIVSIDHDSIKMEVHHQIPIGKSHYIPLVLDPWTRFTPNWGDIYSASVTTDGIRWGIASGIKVEIYSEENISFYPFNLTHEALLLPEDPNFDYTPGHYLPFPMALAEIHAMGDYSLEISLIP